MEQSEKELVFEATIVWNNGTIEKVRDVITYKLQDDGLYLIVVKNAKFPDNPSMRILHMFNPNLASIQFNVVSEKVLA